MYQKFKNTEIFRLGKLYLVCSPGNQDYQTIIHFVSSKKVEIDNAKVVFLLELVIINETRLYIFESRTLITDFDRFLMKKLKNK